MRYLTLLLLSATVLVAAEPEFSDVFTSKTEGYASIRIPAVIVTKAGSVLAFAEGRQRPTDQAENDIIMKRSSDGGRTWSPLRVLHDDGAHSLNNPTVVQEQASGRTFLWYQRIPSHLKEHSKETATGLDGPDIYRNFILTSDDDGATWSAPLDVTKTTKRPERATTIASGPGIGIQLTRGPHQGRLIIPFNEGPYGKWQNYAVFSDDAGKTWTYGDDVPGAMVPDGKGGERSRINEVQMAELPDGSVLLDSRQFAGAKVRKKSMSRDGGKTWSAVEEFPGLTDPSCMASTIRYSFAEGAAPSRLLHSGPDSTKRERGTIYLSTDEGKTWPTKRVLYPGGFAYSVLTRFSDGTVGCLFEADNYGRIVFARFPIAWVSEKPPSDPTVPEARLERTGKFAWWPVRHEQKVTVSKAGGVELAFLGDSITQGWEGAGRAEWEKRYASRKAVNYGFGGDSTQHVLWRLDHGEFDGIQPKVCVLLIGTNNVRHGEAPPEKIAAGVRAILDRLAAKSPSTKVLLLAIFPRGATPDDPWRQKCDAVNRLLPTLADGKRVHFLDLSANFLRDGGAVPKELMPDLLHLSAAGYGVWAEAMEPKLRELLGEE